MTNAQRAGQAIYKMHQRFRSEGLRDRFKILCRMEELKAMRPKDLPASAWDKALNEYKRTLLAKYLEPAQAAEDAAE